MLRRLYIDQMFKHFDRTFDFSRGLTGIIGQNEAGKSLIVEAIRYALFGSAALRGKAEDYKKLHVELDFTVNGTDYTVVRKGAKTELSGGRQASGTKPVNDAIRSILGYGLDVFDVANSCNQGNVEALSSMTPTARRAMVDRTIGLNVLDDLIAFCGTEGNAHKRSAQMLEARLVEPVEPVKPEGYVPSASIQLNTAEVNEYHRLSGEVSNAPTAPAEPGPCPVTDDVEAHEAHRQEVITQNARVRRELAQLEPEQMTLEEIEDHEARIEIGNRVRQRDKLLAQGHLCCPSCNHQWAVAGDALKAFDDLPEVYVPSLMTMQELRQHRARLGNNEKRAQLVEQEVPVDRSDDLHLLVQHRARVRAYEAAKAAYDRFHEGLDEKLARLRELEGCEDRLRELQVCKQVAVQYESDMTRYDMELQRYNLDKQAADEAAGKAEEYLQARERLQALKVSVKSHLLPSLNKVASMLLAQMTGGERAVVDVSEDFEITIDGQAIGTLSGSGKAVANLAIRIALGQILTNRVFSVFLADEVDAAMDDDRATHTAEALRRLTDHVQQVVLVTHKRPEVDHLFELRK